jgi:hypothetical protein
MCVCVCFCLWIIFSSIFRIEKLGIVKRQVFERKAQKNRKTQEESFVLNKDNASTIFLLPLLLKLSRMNIHTYYMFIEEYCYFGELDRKSNLDAFSVIAQSTGDIDVNVI